ncbi:hypothetical protein IJT17_05250 [bacterium]|nr:hypothetical protein [bacterium]
MRAKEGKYASWLLLLAIIAFFSVLIGYLGITNTLASDEGIYRYPDGHFESNGMLYYALQTRAHYAWHVFKEQRLHIFSEPDAWQNRGLACLCGIIMLISSFWLGRTIKDSRLGIILCFVLGCNCAFQASAACGRFYTVAGMLKIWATKQQLNASRRQALIWWAAYAVCLISMLLGSVMTAAVLLLHLFAVLAAFRTRANIFRLAVCLAAALLCLGWLFSRDSGALQRINSGASQQNWLSCLLCNGYSDSFIDCAPMGSESIGPERQRARRLRLGILASLSLAMLLGSGAVGSSYTRQRDYCGMDIAVLWTLLLAVSAIAAYSYFCSPVVAPRHMPCLIPIAALGIAISSHRWRIARQLWLTAVLLASPLMALSTNLYQNIDYRAIHWIRDRYRAGDICIFDVTINGMDTPYYLACGAEAPLPCELIDRLTHGMERRHDVRQLLSAIVFQPYAPYRRVFVLTADINAMNDFLRRSKPGYIGSHPCSVLINTVPHRYILCLFDFSAGFDYTARPPGILPRSADRVNHYAMNICLFR